MNPTFDTYIQSLAGRDVNVIGAGVSNSPLIHMLFSAGAHVTVRDRLISVWHDAILIGDNLQRIVNRRGIRPKGIACASTICSEMNSCHPTNYE